MEEKTCPVCDVELEVDEVYDGDIGLNTREEEWYGHCPRCGIKYHWTEVYEYKETVSFEICSDKEDN